MRDAQGRVQSRRPIDPGGARRVTVWGDLAELDHAGSQDDEGLRAHWCGRVERWLDLGFEGFRCDAAYKVPAATCTSPPPKSPISFDAVFLSCRSEQMHTW